LRAIQKVIYLTFFVALLGTLGGWLYSRQVLFRVKEIEVRTADALIRHKLERDLVSQSGRSLFALNLREIEGELMKNPELRSVRVLRVWPDRLVLEPQIKEAVAIGFQGKRLWLLDEEGERIRPMEEARALPLLLGFPAEGAVRTEVSQWILGMKQLADEDSFFHLIDEVLLSHGQDLSLKVASLGLRIDLGFTNWTQRWRRAEAAFAALQGRGIQALHLDASKDPKVFVYESVELHKSESGLNLKELVRRTRDVRPEAR